MYSFAPSTVRRYLNQLHLTLENVSGIAGLSPQHMTEIESGKRDPRLLPIKRMAAAGMQVLIVQDAIAPDLRRYVANNGRIYTK
jgi:transcriptional regulator with XRE-family HTH domain